MGNCIQLDSTQILSVTSAQKKSSAFLDPFDDSFIKQYDLKERAPTMTDHDYSDMQVVSRILEIKKNIVTYVAGYTVKMTRTLLKCIDCSNALVSKDASKLQSPGLLMRKNRGGFVIVSEPVEFICHQTEIIFNRLNNQCKNPDLPDLPLKPGFHSSLATIVAKRCFEMRN